MYGDIPYIKNIDGATNELLLEQETPKAINNDNHELRA